MANINLTDSSNIEVVQNGGDISLDFTAGGQVATNTTNIGTLANLTTNDKTDLVSAINDVNKASNFIVASYSSNQTLTNNNATLVNIDTNVNSNGSLLTLDTNNHNIKVGAGVNHVEVSAQVYVGTVGTAGAKNAYIYITRSGISTQVARALLYLTNNYNTISITPTIISVQQNDLISLQFLSMGGTTTQINGDSTGVTNRIVVKVID